MRVEDTALKIGRLLCEAAGDDWSTGRLYWLTLALRVIELVEADRAR